MRALTGKTGSWDQAPEAARTGRHALTACPAFGLSPREADALRLLALGLSRAEAAAHLTISEHTIRDYIDAARLKLGARNTVHAVARAVASGAIAI